MQDLQTTSRSNQEGFEDAETGAKAAIRAVFNALASDYGDRFLAQFRQTRDYTPNTWKWRLYKRLYGCPPGAIVEGYEGLIAQLAGSSMPTIDEIVQAIRRRRRELDEIAGLCSETAGQALSGGLTGYVEALESANPGNPVAAKTIAEMRAILKQPPADTTDERRARLQNVVHAHAALLADHQRREKIRRVLLHENPNCRYPGCTRPGTTSRFISGTETWYCMEHFRKLAK